MHTHGFTIGESQTSTRILAFAALRAEFKNPKRVPAWIWRLYNEGRYLKVIRIVSQKKES